MRMLLIAMSASAVLTANARAEEKFEVVHFETPGYTTASPPAYDLFGYAILERRTGKLTLCGAPCSELTTNDIPLPYGDYRFVPTMRWNKMAAADSVRFSIFNTETGLIANFDCQFGKGGSGAVNGYRFKCARTTIGEIPSGWTDPDPPPPPKLPN